MKQDLILLIRSVVFNPLMILFSKLNFKVNIVFKLLYKRLAKSKY